MGIPGPVDIGSAFDEFPGGSFNELVADYFRRQASPRGHHPPSVATIPPFLAVDVKNISGEDAKPGYVLGIDDLVFNPDDNEAVFYTTPTLTGITPASAAHADQFVILRSHLSEGATRAKVGVIMGLASVLLNVGSEEDTHAKVKDGDATQLDSATSGPAKIIWKQPGTGPGKKAVVLLGGGGGGGTSNIREARVTTAIDAASDNLLANWGNGQVKLTNEATGAVEGDPIDVDNQLRDSFAIDCQVFVDMAYSPPRVRNGTCGAVSWA